MTFIDSCQKEEEYAMNVIGKAIYDNLIEVEHLHYEHIIFALETHSELIKQRMVAAHGGRTRKAKEVERVLNRISIEAKESVRQEVKANPIVSDR